MSFDLISFTLAPGGHLEGSTKLCVNEAAAMLAGEPHSDTPQCVDFAIRNLSVTLNDSPFAYDSPEVKAYLEALPWRIVGTANKDAEAERLEIMLRFVTNHAYDITDDLSPGYRNEVLKFIRKATSIDITPAVARNLAFSVFGITVSCLSHTSGVGRARSAELILPVQKLLMKLLDELIAVTEVKEVVPQRASSEAAVV